MREHASCWGCIPVVARYLLPARKRGGQTANNQSLRTDEPTSRTIYTWCTWAAVLSLPVGRAITTLESGCTGGLFWPDNEAYPRRYHSGYSRRYHPELKGDFGSFSSARSSD